MTLNEIETALGQWLANMPGVPPIAWANKEASPALPYLRTLHQPVTRVNESLDGSIPADKTGIWLVTVVSMPDQFTTQANTIAESIATRFKQGVRLTAGTGTVVITRSEPVAGFVDSANNWAIPVRISYTTEG